MSAEEPDSTQVNPTHVRDFLAWYQKRTGMKGIDLSPEWWHNALRTLTLGELRNGIRSYQRFDSKLRLSPVEFWGLCKGKQDQRSIERFRQMRQALRDAPRPASSKWKQERVRPRIKSSDKEKETRDGKG